jgi:hypothetical protein
MATDCWVAAINASPIPLAQRVLAALPEEPGSISSKQIPVGLAAKYNFDLRNCLGTVLRPKFDFTSVSGIRKAFSAAFTDAEALVSVLGDELLSELEVTRHLIVHRASVIDDEYNRRTSANARVGSMLELSEHKVHQFAECAAINGIAILLFVDDWLKTNAGRTLQKS